jgi:hypothetical protein
MPIQAVHVNISILSSRKALGSLDVGVSTSILSMIQVVHHSFVRRQDVVAQDSIGSFSRLSCPLPLSLILSALLCSSPWVCNCGHPWANHTQSTIQQSQKPLILLAEGEDLKVMEEVISNAMAGNSMNDIQSDMMYRRDGEL